jgi:hypothetical protein
MSLAGQQMAEIKLRHKYIKQATKKQLIECLLDNHSVEDASPGQLGDFLKDAFPRRCKHCGAHLVPDEWEAIDSRKTACHHKSNGYCLMEGHKIRNRFPQNCVFCDTPLKPKTWKKYRI